MPLSMFFCDPVIRFVPSRLHDSQSGQVKGFLLRDGEGPIHTILTDAKEASILLSPVLFSSLSPSPSLNNENAGTRGNPAENPPVQVNGILGGSASFPLKLPATQTVARIEWTLRAGSDPEVVIAELKDGKLELQNTRERFRQRLEMADGTTLRIRALEKKDNSTLEVRVVFTSREVLRQTFHLSIFEPVPDPEIRPHLVSRTAEVCNVTLHCLASEKRGIEVSWKRGNSSDQPGVPEEGSDTDLHVSWRPNSLDSTFTCLLSNPADQKSASLDLASICRSEDDGRPVYVWILGLVPFLILVAGVGIWLWKKRSRPKALPLTKSEKRVPPEYPEVQKKRSPPEGDDNQSAEAHPVAAAILLGQAGN
uniref:Uncharacterized protein n=1 Tax=Sphaerodactylus townsendi TaxID=933632 RepID=A0ACB8G6P3_9SAUR